MSDQLTVFVKGSPVTFTTDLSWLDAINILREVAKTSGFAASLLERETKNQYMSASQVAWVYKLAEDARKAQAEPEQKAPQVSADNILASLLSAIDKGLKRPTLRLNYTQDGETYQVKINYVKSSGKCWFTINSLLETKSLVGMIDDSGEFKPFRSGLLQLGISVESFAEWVSEINGNVLSALETYGKMTSTCSCCGLPLTNKKSIELGIGPICLEKYGLMAAI
jgi:hypothetical protein